MAGRRNGFTLIELLVVMVILGLLVGLVGPRVTQYIGSSKTRAAELQIQDLSAALDLYFLDLGRYPTTDEGLAALVRAPAQSVGDWNGPYLRRAEVPPDPWGHPYGYRSPGRHGPFDLYTYGADATEGGDGENRDVVSW